MATIITKNGSGSAVPPSLIQGELAINVDEGKLFYGSGSGGAVRTITASLALSASYLIGGGAGTPGGANTTIQFNDSNTFSGSGNFTFTKATNTVKLSGSLNFTGSLLVTQSYISRVDYIEFTSASDQPTAAARLGWNDADGTLNLGLKGGNVDLLIGEAQFAYVFNDEATTLNKGEVVYISGSQGNRISVKRASASTEGGSAGTLGFVAEAILSGQTGIVISSGVFPKLNTSGLVAGASLFLSSSAGQYTTIKPIPPIHAVRLGYVERVHPSVGSIYVKVDNGYEIGELHDVIDNTTTSSYGDLLVKSGSVWHNSKQLTGSYAITGSLEATSFTGSLQGTSSWAVSASQATTASFALNAPRIIKKDNITLLSASWAAGALRTYLYTDSDISSSSSVVDFTPNTASIATVIDAVIYPTVVVTTGTASFFATNQPAANIVGELVITNI